MDKGKMEVEDGMKGVGFRKVGLKLQKEVRATLKVQVKEG